MNIFEKSCLPHSGSGKSAGWRPSVVVGVSRSRSVGVEGWWQCDWTSGTIEKGVTPRERFFPGWSGRSEEWRFGEDE